MEAHCARVVRVSWLKEELDLVEVMLYRPPPTQPVAYHATPLHNVEEGNVDDEVRVGDVAVLAGQYMIIATEVENRSGLYYMTNYLRVVSADPKGNQSARGANRAKPRQEQMSQITFV